MTLALIALSTPAFALTEGSFESTGLATTGGFSAQIDCQFIDSDTLAQLKTDAQTQADQKAQATCELISNQLNASRAGETRFSQSCYYTGPFRSVTHISVSATATYTCVNVQ